MFSLLRRQETKFVRAHETHFTHVDSIRVIYIIRWGQSNSCMIEWTIVLFQAFSVEYFLDVQHQTIKHNAMELRQEIRAIHYCLKVSS